MTDQIKPGDLVMVVKPLPCCGDFRNIGKIFNVIDVCETHICCKNCKSIRKTKFVYVDGLHGEPLGVLKKLNPPADEESREATKELEVA